MFVWRFIVYYGLVGLVFILYLLVNKLISICVVNVVKLGMLCYLRSFWFYREKMGLLNDVFLVLNV